MGLGVRKNDSIDIGMYRALEQRFEVEEIIVAIVDRICEGGGYIRNGEQEFDKVQFVKPFGLKTRPPMQEMCGLWIVGKF